jgi:hypothetical protein
LHQGNKHVLKKDKSSVIDCSTGIHSEDSYAESSVCYETSETALELVDRKKRIEAKLAFRSLLVSSE